MVAYSFKKQFAEPILAGTKGQTIRADRKRHARPGEEVQLYTGMRTKHCKLIGHATCAHVGNIVMIFRGRPLVMVTHKQGSSTYTSSAALNRFARADGFRDWDDMSGFWAINHITASILDFTGIIIRWRDLRV